MIATIAFLLLRQGSISIDMGGARVRDIVAQVAEQSGRRLATSTKLGDEILIVRASNVSADSLLARLATVEDAEWKMIGNTLTLVRSSETERQEAAQETLRRVAELKLLLSKQLPVPGDGPQDRIIRRAITAIGVDRLARIPLNTTSVWASSPTPMQHLWPGSVAGIVRGFMDDRERFSKQLGQEEEAVKAPAQGVATPPDEEDAPPPTPEVVINTQTVTRLLVRVHYDQSQEYSVSVVFQGANGKSLLNFSDIFNLADLAYGVGDAKATKPLPEVSKSAKEYRDFFSSGQRFNGRQIPTDVRERLTQPDRYDPLSLFAADYLQATFPKDRALVASVPDNIFQLLLEADSGESQGSPFQVFLRLFCVADLSQPGWTLIRPAYPIQARATRANRVAMGEFFRRHADDIGTDLRSVAAFTLTQPRGFYESLAWLYGGVLSPYLNFTWTGTSPTLRILGSLTPEQQTIFLRGGALPYHLLPAGAQSETYDWIFNQLEVSSTDDATEETPLDPTDAFPDGRMNNAALSTKIEPMEILIPLYEGKPLGDGRAYLPMSVGNMLERESIGRGRLPGKTIGSYFAGRRVFVHSELISPRFQATQTVAELQVDRNAPVTLQNLPAATREGILAGRKRYRDNLNGARPVVKP